MSDETVTSPTSTRADVIGNLLVAVVGGAALLVSLGYGVLRDGGLIGPGFLPAVAGGLMLAFALAEVGKIYLGKRSGGGDSIMDQVQAIEEQAAQAVHDHDDELDTFGRTKHQRTTAIVKVFGSILAGVLLVPVLGLLVSVGVLILALTLWVERRPVLPSVLTAVGAVLFAWVVFVQLLSVPVPTGVLGLI